MKRRFDCPDQASLQKLLSETLPTEQEATLETHVEDCPHCQQRLAELSAGEEPWPGAAHSLESTFERDERAVTHVIERLKRRTPPPGESPAAADVALDFLEPAGDAKDCLGRLGAYEIQDIVGRGGMGVVLRGFDRKLDRVVAIKVLAPELAANATARRRFLREAKAAAAVNHPQVVTIHAVEDSAQLPYLVMEYVQGQSLEAKIARQGILDEKEILRISMQIASGLAAAHAQGLVHRDIKPANILLENGVERVRISDFGLARAVDDVGMTRTGEAPGTPQYMSPEQAQGKAVDARSDLFSLGSVLYAMCTGRSPFRADTTIAVIRRVCDDAPRPIRDVHPEIPPWLVEIIDRLLEKDPDKRFQGAAEVAELLGRHLARLQTPDSTPPSTSNAAPPRNGRPRRYARWLLALGLLVLAAGGIGLTERTGVTGVADYVATVLRIRTPQGILVLEINDPGVKVSIEGNGKEVFVSGAGVEKLELRPGEYKVRATKGGQPVHEELVTIIRDGRRVFRVTREPEASKPALPPVDRPHAGLEGNTRSPEREAFVVLGDDDADRKFDTLAEAAAASDAGDTIEIRGNGPFYSEALTVPHALTIRAAEGFRPVVRLEPAVVAAGKALLDTDSPLVLEGIALERSWPIDPALRAPPVPRVHLVGSGSGKPLYVLNCRLYNVYGPCLTAHGALAARNCELITPQWPHRDLLDLYVSTESRFLIDNSVLTSHCMLHLPRSASNGVSLQLTRNSTIGHVVVLTVDGLPDVTADQDGQPSLRVDARWNVFAVPELSAAAVLHLALPSDFQPDRAGAAEESLPRLLQWREARNVYQAGRPLLGLSLRKEEGEGFKGKLLTTKRGGNLADWNRLWELSDTGSIEGSIRFQSKSIYGLVRGDTEQTTAEAFRLGPDSAGYRAGPDGKDLGADIESVGPGPAYEGWKKTPEYQEWLKETERMMAEAGAAPSDQTGSQQPGQVSPAVPD